VSEVRIKAETRTEFGKGAARRTRRAGQIPAVVYGHGGETRHVSLPGRDLTQALRRSGVLLELDLESGLELALPKSVQRDPVRQVIEHVDLVIVKRGQRVVVEVPVQTEGAAIGGGIVETVLTTVALEVEATKIPQAILVDVDKTEAGHSVSAGDLVLPEGAVLVTEPDALVIHVVGPQSESAGSGLDAEAVAESAAAESAAAESAAEAVEA
jgi:large subunit ribosomal protein L25